MPTFITQFEEAAASISAGVGGYFDFLMLHFGAYATPQSFGEFLLFVIAGVVLTQMIAISKSLAEVHVMPADTETEMDRLQQQIGRLSRTMTILQAETGGAPLQAPRQTAATTDGQA